MIRVHLIRHCYPLPSAISDRGIKYWTSFWVILGAQRETTYTPLSQWGLGFVVKPWEQRESVFPEQRPCPRLGLAILLTAHFLEWKTRRRFQDKSWAESVSPFVWLFKTQYGQKVEQSKETAAGRTKHLNPIVNKKLPNLLMLLCISDLSLPTSYPHAPPPMDDKKNPLFNQQWQSLTQIVLGRLHGGLLSFTEAMGIQNTILKRWHKHIEAKTSASRMPAGFHLELTLGCWASSALLQVVMLE